MNRCHPISGRLTGRITTWLITPCSGVSLSYQDLGRRQTETTHQQRVDLSESRRYWTCYRRVASPYTSLCLCWRWTFGALWCNKDDVTTTVLPDVFVDIQSIIHWLYCVGADVKPCSINQSNVHLLSWWLNLTLRISQGSASTYFSWNGHFRYSFVECVFQDSPPIDIAMGS